jgi:hypothetical protein
LGKLHLGYLPSYHLLALWESQQGVQSSKGLLQAELRLQLLTPTATAASCILSSASD